MKRLIAITLLCVCFATGSDAADAGKTTDDANGANKPKVANAAKPAGTPDAAVQALLEKETPGAWNCDGALDSALALIGERTGLKVVCPEALAAVYHELDLQCAGKLHITATCTGYPGVSRDAKAGADGKPEMILIGKFLSDITWSLKLSWKIDAAKGTISLEPIWRKDDPRTAAELMKELMDGGLLFWQDQKEFLKVFEALLGKEQNFARAVGARQRAEFKGFLVKPVVCDEIVTTKREKYIFVALSHDSGLMPSCDMMSYYWFKPDGTLVGAGLTSTGSRSLIVAGGIVDMNDDDEVEAPVAGDKMPVIQLPKKPLEPSEFQVVYRGQTGGGFGITAYVLGEDGLKYKRPSAGYGQKPPKAGEWNPVQSYLPVK